MNTLGFVPSVVLALLVTGCITNKDVGLDSETGDESSSGASASGSGTSGTASSSASGSGVTSESESDTATDTGTIGGTESSSTTGSGSDTGDEGSSSSTGGDVSVEQQICEAQGGTWDPTSCGHYECGAPPDCAAVIPGCDCGPFATFTKAGCTPQAECGVEFACGPELTCTASGQFCSVFVPGVKGADTSYTCEDTPDACLGGYSCGCLEDAGVFGAEGDCTAGGDGAVTVTVYGA